MIYYEEGIVIVCNISQICICNLSNSIMRQQKCPICPYSYILIYPVPPSPKTPTLPRIIRMCPLRVRIHRTPIHSKKLDMILQPASTPTQLKTHTRLSAQAQTQLSVRTLCLSIAPPFMTPASRSPGCTADEEPVIPVPFSRFPAYPATPIPAHQLRSRLLGPHAQPAPWLSGRW